MLFLYERDQYFYYINSRISFLKVVKAHAQLNTRNKFISTIFQFLQNYLFTEYIQLKKKLNIVKGQNKYIL